LEDGREMGANGRLLVGDNGKILGNRLIPESKQQASEQVPKTLPRSIGHHKEWIEACKGGKPAGSNFDWAGPLAEVVLLGNVALRTSLREQLTKTRLNWDGQNMRFTNMEEANKYLRREYRQGWSL